jgi:serine/threonine protein kinase
MKDLDHPNIIKYESCFWYQGHFYRVNKLADDGNLLNKAQSPLNETQIIEILVQILEGLKYLHNHHIIHRD